MDGTATSTAKGSIYDRATHGNPYAVDDLVWLHCPAVPRLHQRYNLWLHPYWQGPYRVVKQISDVLFLLQHRDSR